MPCRAVSDYAAEGRRRGGDVRRPFPRQDDAGLGSEAEPQGHVQRHVEVAEREPERLQGELKFRVVWCVSAHPVARAHSNWRARPRQVTHFRSICVVGVVLSSMTVALWLFRGCVFIGRGLSTKARPSTSSLERSVFLLSVVVARGRGDPFEGWCAAVAPSDQVGSEF